jgi:cyclohexadieny/prephenate dehydrogenase
MSQIYDRVALIGLGLIASSIFWASKRNNVSGCVTGFARSKKTRDTAKKIGLCDEIFDTAEEAVKDADLVILCVPVGAMEQVVLKIAPFLKSGATISDVGSVKRAVIELAPSTPDQRVGLLLYLIIVGVY